MRAHFGPREPSRARNIAYPTPHHIIMTTSWRIDSQATIVSSFSICKGILYCII